MITRIFSSNLRNLFVAGDLHGDYQSYRAILSIFENRRKDALLIFLGDYADRGLYGMEEGLLLLIHVPLMENRSC